MCWVCFFALLSCTSSPMLPLSRRFKVIWVAFPSVTNGVNGVEDAAEDGVKVMDNCPGSPLVLGKHEKLRGFAVAMLGFWYLSVLVFMCFFATQKPGHGFGATHCNHWNVEDVHIILRGKNLSHLGKAKKNVVETPDVRATPPQTNTKGGIPNHHQFLQKNFSRGKSHGNLRGSPQCHPPPRNKA